MLLRHCVRRNVMLSTTLIKSNTISRTINASRNMTVKSFPFQFNVLTENQGPSVGIRGYHQGRHLPGITPSELVREWDDNSKRALRPCIRQFQKDKTVKELAVEQGVHYGQYNTVMKDFVKGFVSSPHTFFTTSSDQIDFITKFVASPSSSAKNKLLLEQLMAFAKKKRLVMVPEEEMFTSLDDVVDFQLPHEWYPSARAMKRKIIYHGGPTNSGKTYEALQRLKQSNSGVYCGPLRLLALEIYEKLNIDGVYCSLLTGQERREIPGASHFSSTVEMCNLNKIYDVAVLDEIQLISDTERGWAWTRALLGLQASEIHVCGSMEVAEMLKTMVKQMGDEFELRTYDRRNKLLLEDKPLTTYKNIQKGDCVVTFSRRRIFQIKSDIESKTSLKCCVIYGSLPPETRSNQARLFNSPDSGYDVLIASDAIGMGLNLNMQRIVFDVLKKYNGSDFVEVNPALVKQIAGRAGRSGSDYDQGYATCLHQSDMAYLKEAYNEKAPVVKAAGIFPSSEQMEDFANHLPAVDDYSVLLDKFVNLARFSGFYFMCNHGHLTAVLELIKDIPLSMSERYVFSMTPVNIRHPVSKQLLVDFAKMYSQRVPIELNVRLPTKPPTTSESLRAVEDKSRIVDTYMWLAQRYSRTFVDGEKAEQLQEKILELVSEGLRISTDNMISRRTSNTSKYNGRKKTSQNRSMKASSV